LLTTEQMLQQIAEACGEEKALDVVALDVSQLTVIADYFVIAAGRNVLQVKSIADRVEERLAEAGVKPLRREGYSEGIWVVLDYGSILFHVFRQEEREYYDLENLWGDARKVRCQASQLFT
jgi:ribosome-associated protein